MSLHVVNLGLPKTGTTTLARALRRAGLHTVDHRVRPELTKSENLHNAYVADLLYRGLYEAGDPAAYLSEFQAISEMSVLREGRSLWPQMDFAIIDALRRAHPQLKFLATWRDPFATSQSMLAWSNLGTSRIPQADIPGLPAGFGDTTSERTRWINSHYAHLDTIFAGSERYLRVDITAPDAPNKIAAFLGRKLPWWGHLNRNPENVVA